VGYAIGDLRPGRAVVVGLVEIGMEVVELVAIGGEIGGGGIVWGRLDDADQRPFGQVFRGDVLPGGATVAREVNQAVVGASPQQPLLDWRFGEGEDGGLVFGADVIASDWPAGGAECARVVAGEVGADFLPARAL